MKPIYYIDRASHTRCEEKVYGADFIRLLYGDNLVSRIFGVPIAYAMARLPCFSALYGYLQNQPASAKKIEPFINTFDVDTSEFAKDPYEYVSFNDFFTRKLKADARPIAGGESIAIIPADGRYYFYENIKKADGFVVKGKKFDLATLLQDEDLAAQYEEGSMVIARLCPTDYHRYHFPCTGFAGKTVLINGWLHSVNPAAIKKNVDIFTENKRTLCELDSEKFGKVLYLEIGATCVGAIHQTYTPDTKCAKGDEKGYFSFGASSLILLFPPNSIQFDQDLLNATAAQTEIKCLMGQPMGIAL
ncbi:MAG TPA: archaetidylserine decarboxylase [Parachlamydiaceae bacterium]|nr:archaetidylserine decarboxylase [Parachlamydiaceae bacterium]